MIKNSKVAGFGLNSRKSLRKAKSLLRCFRAFRVQSGIAVDCLDGHEQNSMLAISVITQMELFVGCRNKTELENTKHFLQRFQVFKLSGQISDKAIGLLLQYRLSHGLAIPDALIAATAITFNQPFISKNQRDYRFISELRLLPYF